MATAKISAGPGKFDLSVALFRAREEVEFTLGDRIVRVVVTRAKWDESQDKAYQRENWILKGFIIDGTFPNKRFKASYNTQRRKGQFEVID